MSQKYLFTGPKGYRKVFDLSEKQVAAMSLSAAGGGFTEEQTTKAMQIQEKLCSGQVVKLNQFEAQKIEDGEFTEV